MRLLTPRGGTRQVLVKNLAAMLRLDDPPAVESRSRTAQRPARLTAREAWAEAVVGGAFLVVAVALALLGPSGDPVAAPYAVGLVAAFAVASRVEFEVGCRRAASAQLLLVPMLFLLPPGAVPLCAAGALLVARLPDRVVGRPVLRRALTSPGDAWFAVGPAAMLVLADAPEAAGTNSGLLVGALAAQFFCDFIARGVRELLNASAPLPDDMLDRGWTYVVDLMLAPIGFLAALAADGRPWAAFLLLPAVGLLALLAGERGLRIDRALALGRAYHGAAMLLGEAAERGGTGAPSRGVVQLAVAVAEEMGLGPVQRRNVELGALLHDIGKITVPSEILDKPGALDESEWSVVRGHTGAAQKMLVRFGGVLVEAGRVVRSSHERWDGRGYPDCLRGEAIPVESRILLCVRAYCAMTAVRSYRAARSSFEALEEIRDCSGTQFDPQVVRALVTVVARDGGDEIVRALDAQQAVPA
jgi:hypothetical protein